MHDVVIRYYSEEDDLNAIINLYKSTNNLFSRDFNFFRYFTKFPGILKERIIVALVDGVIDGVAVVSISENEGVIEGKIIELVAKSSLGGGALIQKVEEYCRSKNVDIIFFKSIVNYDILDQYLTDWMKDEAGVMMVKSLSMLPILQFLLDGDLIKRFYVMNNILFVFNDEMIELKISDNFFCDLHSVKEITDSELVIKMDSKTFLEIIFGLTNPYIAYVVGKVKIRGLKKVYEILKLLKCFEAKMNKSTSIVDDI